LTSGRRQQYSAVQYASSLPPQIDEVSGQRDVKSGKRVPRSFSALIATECRLGRSHKHAPGFAIRANEPRDSSGPQAVIQR
jgi:hypothetical protein